MRTEREYDLLLLGRATGKFSSRAEAEQIIEGLLTTIRSLRESPQQSFENEKTIFSLQAAISGIRETMPCE